MGAMAPGVPPGAPPPTVDDLVERDPRLRMARDVDFAQRRLTPAELAYMLGLWRDRHHLGVR
jgi:hypothetical protein